MSMCVPYVCHVVCDREKGICIYRGALIYVHVQPSGKNGMQNGLKATIDQQPSKPSKYIHNTALNILESVAL